MRKEISSREDVRFLVKYFYAKVRKEPTICHYFNKTIDDWVAHEEKLTDFWETNLFFETKYKGNPKKVHLEVDRSFHHSIEQKHFGIWLNLWFETIDEYFHGQLADCAKNNARKMASHLFMKIYQNRQNKSGSLL